MLTVSQARDRAADLVSAARRAGADAAEAMYAGDRSTDAHVRLGKLENAERADGEEIGLRVFIGKRSASVSASDLSSAALKALATRAVAMAREAPADEYAGLAPEDRLLKDDPPALDLDDGVDPDPAALRERALAAEDAARAVAGVTNSEGASAGAGSVTVALATSHGFVGGYRQTGHSVSASVLAGEGARMQRAGAHHSARHLADLDECEAIGHRAGERAVARLDPIKPASGPMPVVFDPRVGNGLIGHLLGAISGPAIARRTSFLLELLGERVFGEGVTILDDPHRPRGLRSKPFDGEGLPTGPRALIDAGVLTGWLLDSASARQLGLEPTGHASRGGGVSASNVHIAAGSLAPEALMADIGQGVYVTELIGMGVNGVTGDYSRGAAGFLIENGVLGRAVAEITIAGNLKSMFRELTPASDLEFRYAVNAPTLRVDGMTIAGG